MTELTITIRKIFENHIEYRVDKEEYVLKGSVEDFYTAIMDEIIRWLRKALKMEAR